MNSNIDIWVAGAAAAVSVDFMVYPFDTLKTRMQSADYETRYKDRATGAIRRNVLYRGLYQGVWSVVLATIPASGAFFTTYEGVKYTLGNMSYTTHSPSQQATTYTLPTPITHATASSIAEMVSCLMITPAEVLKQNAQVIHNQTRVHGHGGRSGGGGGGSVFLSVASRFRHKPWKLWSGYTALVGRNLPFTGLHFPLFEYVRSHLVAWRAEHNKRKTDPRGQGRESNPVAIRAVLTGLAAAFSGTVASVVTTPTDVIKTRMMLAADGADSVRAGKVKEKKTGTVEVGKQIYQKEGVRGLFRGGLLKAGWTALSLGLYLGIYEGGRLYLENRRKDSNTKDGNSVI